jgi:hypothetical protein
MRPSVGGFRRRPGQVKADTTPSPMRAHRPWTMTVQEKLLYHHDHPAKLIADAITAIVAAVLLWQQHLIRAAAVGLVLPALASACVLSFADVQRLVPVPSGRSGRRGMTWTMVLVRIAGVVMLWAGAWYRSMTVSLAGVAVIALTRVHVDLSTAPGRGRVVSTSARRLAGRMFRVLHHQKRLVAFGLLFLGIANIIVAYLAGHSFRGYILENADLLYLPTLFSDLMSKGGRISDWFLTPAPYFFPDYPLYFVAHVLGASTYARIVIFCVAQTLLTCFAIWLLAWQASRADPLTVAVTVTIALIWFALTLGEPFAILFASASHYGSFVSAIILVGLWMQYETNQDRRGSRVLLPVIGAVVFLATLSDNFFIVQAIVPFVAATILVELADEPIREWRPLLVIAWLLSALMVPTLTYRLPIPPPAVNVAWSSVVDDEQRASLEARFHLTDGYFRNGRLWTYHLTDTTPANVGALVASPDVEDTSHIDRQSFAVDGASGPLWRAVSTVPIGLVLSAFVTLSLVWLVRMWSDLRQGRPLKRKLLVLTPVVFSALGSMSYNLVVTNHTRYTAAIGLEKAADNTRDVAEAVHRAIASSPAYGLLLVGYLALVPLVCYGRAGRWVRTNIPKSLRWLVAFSFLSLCSTVVTATLMTDLPVMSRYLIPAFSWPVVVVLLFAGHALGERFFAVATVASLLGVVLLGAGSYELAQKNGLSRSYYPADIACVDNALERAGLSHGIAQYWDAKYLQQFSRLNLTIAQHLQDLEELKWITSSTYFRDSYDFAIISEDAEAMDKISSAALLRINGAPREVVSCGNRSVYLYGKSSLRTAERAASGKT